jgi:hypothetical protein
VAATGKFVRGKAGLDVDVDGGLTDGAIVGANEEFVALGMVGNNVVADGETVGLNVGLDVALDELGADVVFWPIGGRICVELKMDGAVEGASDGRQSSNVNLCTSTAPNPSNELAGT